jgi:hypothetical protein
MAIERTGGAVRTYLTRVLAAGALLAVYAVGTITTSGIFLASTTTVADARRGWRGRGWRGRGWRGRGVVGPWCHRPWSSRRYYCW